VFKHALKQTRSHLGKLFSNISKSDTPNGTTPNPLDPNRTRPHAVPESDGKSFSSLYIVESGTEKSAEEG
jgi:hypothetical protein